MNKTYIIAEAGVNHNGNINTALKLVDVAKKTGADAVKFQLFDIDEQISDLAPTAYYQKKSYGNISMKKMAKSYQLPWKAHIRIKNYCKKLKIQYLSSCCDVNSINFLTKKLKTKTIKISSGEITNYKLLKHATKKANKVILSTGMSNLKEIKKAVEILKKNKKTNIILLHCISAYPTKNKDLNLKAIQTLKKEFKLDIGFSDHSLGYEGAVVAVSLGAKVIEKHFTLSKKMKGPDHLMSLEPNELKKYIFEIRETEKILGSGFKKPISEELELIKIARRGIFSKKEVLKGKKITSDYLTLKRPVIGIPAEKINQIIGKKAKKNIPSNFPIFWKDIN